MKIKQEFGTDNMYRYCVRYSQNLGLVNRDECIEAIDKVIKPIGSCTYNSRILNYTKDKSAYIDVGSSYILPYKLSDGSCFQRAINGATLGFTIDINGDKKGPNALGHDVFVFWVQYGDFLKPVKMSGYYGQDDMDRILAGNDCGWLEPGYCSAAAVQQFGMPCSRKSGQMGNGLGCSWYALNDVCPDDTTKGYWDCLP